MLSIPQSLLFSFFLDRLHTSDATPQFEQQLGPRLTVVQTETLGLATRRYHSLAKAHGTERILFQALERNRSCVELSKFFSHYSQLQYGQKPC